MNTNKLPAEAGHPEVNAADSLWNEFLDQLPVAYIEVNEHGVISRANQRAIDIHPAEAGALVGQLVWEYLPTETQEVACAQFFQMMESGEDPPPAHLHLYTSGGEFRLFDVRRNLMRDDVGKPIGMRAVSFDITEAHQAEKETRKRMQWLESAFDSAQDAVVLTDAMGMVSYVNPATEKILGKMRDELLGKPVEEDFPRVAYSSADGEVLTHNLAMNHATRGVVTVLDAQKREVRLAITTTPSWIRKPVIRRV